jgi:uncharacterized protein (DUF1800 family)
MLVTRRDLLKDLAFAAALVGLPDWVTHLDEMPSAEMMSLVSSSHGNPWPWVPTSDLGQGNPYITVLNRVAFGPRPGDFERIKQIGVDNYIDEQLQPDLIDDSALDKRLADLYPTLTMNIGDVMNTYAQPRPLTPAARAYRLFRQAELGIRDAREMGPQQVAYDLQEATIMRAIFSKKQLFEVMVDFWTNHFNIDIRKNDCRWLKTTDDRDVIRKYSLGKFRDLLLASAQSAAMSEYLDNRINTKGVANENYAREIMELHTLGVDGGYTQKDVQELARALTGWTIKSPRQAQFGIIDYAEAGAFVFNPKQHDDGAKKVLGINIPANGGINDAITVIDALAVHPSTAKFIATKLVRRFVADTPPDVLVQRTAQTFLDTGGDIRVVMSTILHSDEFRNSFGQKIKRPFEFIASVARATDMQLEDARPFALALQMMGQGLFLHATPDGYPDSGSAWINTNNLMARWNLALMVAANRVPRGKVEFKSLFAGASFSSVGDTVDYAVNFILHRSIPDADRQKLIDWVSPNRGVSSAFDANRTPELVALVLSSPHFQYR